MPDAAPIAEASVQITMDSREVNAEVMSLQKNLGPMVSTGVRGSKALGEGFADTSDKTMQLERSLFSVDQMLQRGDISGRGFIHMLHSIGSTSERLGPMIMKGGLVIGAAIAGWQIGRRIRSYILGPEGNLDGKSAQIWADGIDSQLSGALSRGLSKLNLPTVELGIGKQKRVDDTVLKDIQRRADVELAIAEATGRDTGKIKARIAGETSRATSEAADRMIATETTALATVEAEYKKNVEELEGMRLIAENTPPKKPEEDDTRFGVHTKTAEERIKENEEYAAAQVEHVEKLRDIDNQRKEWDEKFASEKDRREAAILEATQKKLNAETQAQVAAINARKGLQGEILSSGEELWKQMQKVSTGDIGGAGKGGAQGPMKMGGAWTPEKVGTLVLVAEQAIEANKDDSQGKGLTRIGRAEYQKEQRRLDGRSVEGIRGEAMMLPATQPLPSMAELSAGQAEHNEPDNKPIREGFVSDETLVQENKKQTQLLAAILEKNKDVVEAVNKRGGSIWIGRGN